MAIIALSRLISIPPSSLHSQKPALLQSYAPALLHPCSAALLHSCSPSLLQNSPHTNLHSFPTAFPPFCPFAFQLSYTVKWREPNWQNLAPIWPQLPNWPNDQWSILLLNSFSIWPFQEPGTIYQFGPNKVQFLKWLIINPKLSTILVTWKSHNDLNDTRT